MPTNQALQVFYGTAPLLVVILWNLIEVKEVRKEITELRKAIAGLAERVSKIEGRIEGRHILVE